MDDLPVGGSSARQSNRTTEHVFFREPSWRGKFGDFFSLAQIEEELSRRSDLQFGKGMNLVDLIGVGKAGS